MAWYVIALIAVQIIGMMWSFKTMVALLHDRNEDWYSGIATKSTAWTKFTHWLWETYILVSTMVLGSILWPFTLIGYLIGPAGKALRRKKNKEKSKETGC